VLLLVGPRLLPEYRDPEAGRLDLVGAAVSLVAVLALIYGLKQIAQDGIGWVAAASILTGLGFGIAFVRRQRELADPLIDLNLFRLPAFNGALAANTLGFFVNFGMAVFIAQYLQLVLGLSPLEAGLWTLPYAGAFVVGALLTSLLARRIPPPSVIAGGLALAAAGFAVLAYGDSLAILVTGAAVFALGLAPVYTLAADLMVGAAPPERAGAAAGISETSSELGGALGIAVLGAVGSAVYRGEVETKLPAGTPDAPAEAARETLGGAVAAADALPDRLAPGLVDAASEAFTQALQVAATISAAVALSAAILAVALLQGARTIPASEEERGLAPGRAVVGGRPC
jgi:MFS transporter, DHA2 family, multidrug resistance protein